MFVQESCAVADSLYTLVDGINQWTARDELYDFTRGSTKIFLQRWN